MTLKMDPGLFHAADTVCWRSLAVSSPLFKGERIKVRGALWIVKGLGNYTTRVMNS
jgi:hypothetical protein